MKNYEDIKNYLLKYVDELGDLITEINSIDNSLEYLECWNNDDDFFNTFFSNNPTEAVRSAYYGNYNYCDEYVRFNGYGNLESFNKWQLEREYKEYIDDIVKSLIEHYQEISICDKELIKLIEEYEENENQEN